MVRQDLEDLARVQTDQHHTEEPVLAEDGRSQVCGDVAFAGRREIGDVDFEQGPDAIECHAEPCRPVRIGAQIGAHRNPSLCREDDAAVGEDEREIVIAEGLLIVGQERPILTVEDVESRT